MNLETARLHASDLAKLHADSVARGLMPRIYRTYHEATPLDSFVIRFEFDPPRPIVADDSSPYRFVFVE